MEPFAPVRKLHGVPETLLIPLAARAYGQRLFPRMGPDDPVSRGVADRLGFDPAQYLVDKGTVGSVKRRTQVLLAQAQDFLRRHPGAMGVNLGAGLATYFEQLDDGALEWVDLDLPEITALREQVLPSTTPRHRIVAASLADDSWVQVIDPQRPTVFLCEGVLTYLPPEQVRAVLRAFAERAHPASEFLAVIISWLVVGKAQERKSMRGIEAEFLWGPRRRSDITAPHPRLEIREERSILDWMPWWWRAVFRVLDWVTRVPFVAVYRIGIRPER